MIRISRNAGQLTAHDWGVYKSQMDYLSLPTLILIDCKGLNGTYLLRGIVIPYSDN